ncbi:MAG: hypothetical protein IKS51_00945 [Erysipelotrichaceae bacterium]|nr:hypothetical protein [Erysipelotrichaceae bacterium]
MRDSRVLLKRVLSILEIVLITAVTAFLLGRALTPVTYADYFNHEMDLLEESGEEIDLLFVGSSRIYNSIDTRIMEEELGLDNVVDASTASQTISGSYYMIKDMIERLKPKKIILGLTCDEMVDEEKAQAMLLVIDRLSLRNKLEMFRHCFYGSDLLYMLDLYRYRDNLDDIFANIQARKELVENDYVQEDDGVAYYCYKGFVYAHGSIKTGNVPMYTKLVFSEDAILDRNVEYLNKCIELCKENGVELELFSAPTTVMRMYYTDHYDEAVEYYQKVADENGLVYHNLNYLVDRETFLPDEMMCDYSHTNGEGAKLVSKLFAEILKKEEAGEDVSEYFYPTFEAFCESVHRIVAVDAKIRKEGDAYDLELRSLQNPGVKVLYQVETENGEVLIPWTEETHHTISKLTGQIKVVARSGDDDLGRAYQVYDLSNYE